METIKAPLDETIHDKIKGSPLMQAEIERIKRHEGAVVLDVCEVTPVYGQGEVELSAAS